MGATLRVNLSANQLVHCPACSKIWTNAYTNQPVPSRLSARPIFTIHILIVYDGFVLTITNININSLAVLDRLVKFTQSVS